MKKTLRFLCLPFVLCLYCNMCSAQWCPSGAQWNYSWMSMGDEGYKHYYYTKDTTVENRNCHVIESTLYSSQHGPPNFHLYDTTQGANLYTYSSGDTVYFFHPIFSKWLPVHFFSAQVGDTLVVPNYALHSNADTTVYIVVDSTGNMSVDTFTARYYCFHVVDTVQWCPFSGKVVERIGILDNDMIPFWHCVTDDYYYAFCSYTDSSLALYPSGAVCRFFTGIELLNTEHSRFSIYPNPASNSFTVSVPESLIAEQLTITDITGKKIAAVQLQTSNSKLETTLWSAGIYFVRVANATQKLIVQH